jgi:hypothetical protein
MPVCRDRDCCGLTKISEILGEHQRFGMCKRFDHFEHGGPVQTGRYSRRDSALKSRAQGAPSSLGDYMYVIQHISKEENETISEA